VDVTRGQNTDASLSGLSLTGGAALSPAFGAGTLSYTSTAAYGQSGIQVIPVADATATVTVGVYGGTPEAVGSGQESSVLPLSVGVNTIEVTVTAQDGTTVRTYTVDVTRGRNTDASLSGLSLTGGVALSPAFDAVTLNYTSTVAYGQSGIQVIPLADATTTVTVGVYGGTPETVGNGQTSSLLPLSVGLNTIEVTVTAQDGTTFRTYTVDITRRPEDSSSSGSDSVQLSDNANLNRFTVKANGDELELMPIFAAETTSYLVETSADEVTIEAIPSDAMAIVALGEAALAGGKTIALSKGDNVFEIIVQAENGTVKSYSLTIRRQTETAESSPSPSSSPSQAELPACTFLDIKGHWAETAICEAAEKGIVDGVSETQYHPQGLVTRVEFAAMLLRTRGVTPEYAAGKLPFTDQDQIPVWATNTVSAAIEMGILQGYPDGTLRPQQTVSRAEMAAMLARVMKWDIDLSPLTSFADDADIPNWAKGYIQAAVQRGLLDGRGDNQFFSHGEATRAEAAVVLIRLWKTLQ
jgi:hypothetical protein